MVTGTVTIKNTGGLHARPASELVALVTKSQCKVYLLNGQKRALASSIINLMTLGAKPGVQLDVEVEGDNEAETLQEVVSFFENLVD